MLARANRLIRADEFRHTVRRGRRRVTENMVVYVLHQPNVTGPRFGLIVSKAVGNAVTRNLIRRRLKSVCRGLVPSLKTETDVVIRALPGTVHRTWTELHHELASALTTSGLSAQGGQN